MKFHNDGMKSHKDIGMKSHNDGMKSHNNMGRNLIRIPIYYYRNPLSYQQNNFIGHKEIFSFSDNKIEKKVFMEEIF